MNTEPSNGEIIKISSNKPIMNALILQQRLESAYKFFKSYPLSLYYSMKNKETFGDVRIYCMFLGYPRSGHSLVGSLIDANPYATISHELDILKFVGRGFSRKQIFSLILENSRGYAENGRINTGYSYIVPNQWQGKYKKLEVIGDKEGVLTTHRLLQKPELLEKATVLLGVEMKFIHVIRNPYDNISTWAKRSNISLERASDKYFELAKTNLEFKEKLGGQVLDVKHEDVIKRPKEKLEEICRFLELETSEEYLQDCASIIYKKPHKSRNERDWTMELKKEVQGRMKEFPFLEGYAYED